MKKTAETRFFVPENIQIWKHELFYMSLYFDLGEKEIVL
ncbi:hypothetical protein JCM19241_2339 [Vibrio ishigakensis]|uniref:Uncharacterized protein n=1 Tax=Vibrio ishigakensis TaxID=1481914 RepID=A0A0B8QDZ8_9VIBR|nr:hypothetical protein JCM19241_2339 [Vibrio ishigakensis]